MSSKAKPSMISSFAAVARALWMAATITFAGVEILGIGKKCPKQKRLRATHIDLILDNFRHLQATTPPNFFHAISKE